MKNWIWIQGGWGWARSASWPDQFIHPDPDPVFNQFLLFLSQTVFQCFYDVFHHLFFDFPGTLRINDPPSITQRHNKKQEGCPHGPQARSRPRPLASQTEIIKEIENRWKSGQTLFFFTRVTYAATGYCEGANSNKALR